MKSDNLKFIAIFIASLISYSCATKVSIDVINHMEIGYQYLEKDDWQSARDHYGKALKLAESEGTHGYFLAIIYYEYGRALGVTCSFKESEQYLLKALELDEKNNGENFKDLAELARLQYDQKKYAEAIVYFEKDFTIMDQLDMKRKAPIAYADLLIEYSEALKHTGNSARAEFILMKAMDIRNKNPERHSITDRTPYGKYCS